MHGFSNAFRRQSQYKTSVLPFGRSGQQNGPETGADIRDGALFDLLQFSPPANHLRPWDKLM